LVGVIIVDVLQGRADASDPALVFGQGPRHAARETVVDQPLLALGGGLAAVARVVVFPDHQGFVGNLEISLVIKKGRLRGRLPGVAVIMDLRHINGTKGIPARRDKLRICAQVDAKVGENPLGEGELVVTSTPGGP